MKVYRWLLVGLFVVLVAGIANAQGDPTFQINSKTDPTCDNVTVFCISNLGNASLTIPAGPFSDTIVYTGQSQVDGLQLLFPDSALVGIAVQSDIFANVTSAPELINGQLFILFSLTGSGPCNYNGVNNPPATCPGVITSGEAFTFSSPDGFSTPETIEFTPEPETLGLMAIGLLALVSRRLLHRSER